MAAPHTESTFRDARRAHWESVAASPPSFAGRAYHRRLADVYRFLIPPGGRVLELGCGDGRLLAALEPRHGVGVDFSPAMVAAARRRHPGLTFVEADVHDLDAALVGTESSDAGPSDTEPSDTEPFDAIVLSDLVNDLWDVQRVFERVAALARPSTRIVLSFYSHLWQGPLRAAEVLGLKRPVLEQSWLTVADVENLLDLADLETLRRGREVLWPLPTPLLAPLANRVLVKLWPLGHLAVTNVLVARPRPRPAADATPPRVSVIVPARNEAGNVEQIFRRTPEMGAGTELIFVEGHSRDETYAAIERAIAEHPERRARLLRQTGKGKGDAVRLGFAAASGEVLMILDADVTVPPEDLPRFYDALVRGKGEYVNGVRLVYPIEDEAMRFLNLLGNKFFSLAFSWLLGQPIKDTLCGTKVLWKRDYEKIAANRGYFGEFDPFGDFDLIFGAARLNLKLIDLPIRYRQRTYGDTNIERWRHGVLLLRMVVFALGKLKFV